MGACSTIDVTRDQAIALLIQAITKASDRELEEILDMIIGGENPMIRLPGICLNNFCVCGDPS